MASLGAYWVASQAAWPAESMANVPALPPDEKTSVILGRPTDRSITLSLLSTASLEARIAYASEGTQSVETTPPMPTKAGAPAEFQIESLKPGIRYQYEIQARSPVGGFQTWQRGTFHTQRSPGAEFTFGVQGDTHPERIGRMYDPALYARTLSNVARNPPDFYIMMGDDFSADRLMEQNTVSPSSVDQLYARHRDFLRLIGHSTPLFLINGNHEQAAMCHLDGTPDNIAVLAGRARNRFYPLPAPNGFYGGDSTEVEHVGLPRDYYSWTWGDALFVTLDPYWHCPAPVDKADGKTGNNKKRDLWQVTLGDTQYQWLAKTLSASTARWKFVFCHHVLGTGRGGVEMAGLFEWGGQDMRGFNRFATHRPGWELPVHQLLAKHKVTVFFQGHDHLYAKQERDGVVYQTCPVPADPTFQAFNRESYLSGDILPNSGHLRVNVSPAGVRVDYVASALESSPAGVPANGTLAHTYFIPV